MKKLGIIIGLVVSLLNASSATWTFHSFRDNAPTVSWSSNTEHWMLIWDLAWDTAFPEDADSGFYHAFIGSYWDTTIIGYQDVWTITIPDEAWLLRVDMYGPYPDYSGWDGHLYWPSGHAWNGQIIPPSATTDSPVAGEYWIDYDSSGVARMSTTQPADWGKWAWDGSINPSWVEPVAPLQRGKHLALGHSK